MPESRESTQRVVHALRTKGMAEVDAVAPATGLSADAVTDALHDLGERGWVRYREGARVSGWMLLGEGRAHAERLAAAEIEDSGLRPQIHSLYESFLELDPKLKEACTDFQLREDQTLNDHTDPDYDDEVIDRLAAVNECVQPVLAELARHLDRFGHYGPRLNHALSQVESGEINWFTKPSLDSYHEVWFELHEDLLVSLGIDRAAEMVPDSADA